MAHRGRQNADAALIAALASGGTQAEAAHHAGVSVRTVARRVAEPDFRLAVQAARAEMIEQATGRLAVATTQAADTLLSLLADESPTVRLSAARALLDNATRYVEATDTTERISRIEALLAAQHPGPQPLRGKGKWAA